MPQIYDTIADEWREITQEEVDHLIRVGQAYGELRLRIITALSDDDFTMDRTD